MVVITVPLLAASRDFQLAVHSGCLPHSIDAWVAFAVKPVPKVMPEAYPLPLNEPSIEDKLPYLGCTDGLVVYGATVPVGIGPGTVLPPGTV